MNESVNESGHVEHILLESRGLKSKENFRGEDKQRKGFLHFFIIIIVFGIKAWSLITG